MCKIEFLLSKHDKIIVGFNVLFPCACLWTKWGECSGSINKPTYEWIMKTRWLFICWLGVGRRQEFCERCAMSRSSARNKKHRRYASMAISGRLEILRSCLKCVHTQKTRSHSTFFLFGTGSKGSSAETNYASIWDSCTKNSHFSQQTPQRGSVICPEERLE